MKQKYEILEQQFESYLIRRGDQMVLCLDDKETPVSLTRCGEGEYILKVADAVQRIWLKQKGDDIFIHLAGRSWQIRSIDPLSDLSSKSGSTENSAIAPMPGTVVALKAKKDEQVAKGTTIMVIESMKMETSIKAWRDGIIEEIHYNVNDTFDRKAVLVTFAPNQPDGQPDD